MSRRKLHFRHPNHASDVPLCNAMVDDRLTTDRTAEVECTACRRRLVAERPRQREFRKVQKEMFQNVWTDVYERAMRGYRLRNEQ